MKAKPVLLVVVTLLIGFVIGMLTSAQIRFHKLQPVRLYFSQDRFREGFYKTIQPDDAQKAEIEKILDKYGKLNSDLQSNFRKEFDSNMKAFRKEIESKLTRDQLARLKEIDDKRQAMIEQARRDHENDTTGNRRDFRRRGPGDGNPFRGERREMPPPPGGRRPMHFGDSAVSDSSR